MLRNSKTRLILASSVLGAGATALVLMLFYWAAYAIFEAETREVVNAELTGLADDYQSLGVLGLGRAIERRLENADERDAVYLLTDAYGRTIAGNLQTWPPTVVPGSGWVELELFRTDGNQSVRVSAASISLQNNERLLVGRDSAGRARFERALVQAAGLAVVAAIVLSLVTGWLLSRLVFNRIADISRTADDIVSGDLGGRVPIRGSGDEFDRLSATLNAMFDRIEALIRNLRTTTDSLAHDLRSPLTRLRTHVEQLALEDLTEQERRDLALRMQSEADHLLSIFTAMTEISRAEAGLGRADFETVDLLSIAMGIAELYEPVASERNINIQTMGSAKPFLGNAPLLAQALSNLVENALRYAPSGSAIKIVLQNVDDVVSVCVSDRGPGIPDEYLTRAIKRFVTLDDSRADRGTGLGLALVSAIAQLHHGNLHLTNNDPGLKAEMTLAAKSKVGKHPG